MQSDVTLTRPSSTVVVLNVAALFIGCLESCWTVTGSIWTPAELSTWRLGSCWTLLFDCSWAVLLMTLLLEYFGECTFRVTVLLEYLDCEFSTCSFHLFYNSLVFNPILLSFGRDCFLPSQQFLTHFSFAACVIGWNNWFFDCAKLLCKFNELSFISHSIDF